VFCDFADNHSLSSLNRVRPNARFSVSLPRFEKKTRLATSGIGLLALYRIDFFQAPCAELL
jgi:hypothetical protein